MQLDNSRFLTQHKEINLGDIILKEELTFDVKLFNPDHKLKAAYELSSDDYWSMDMNFRLLNGYRKEMVQQGNGSELIVILLRIF